MDILSFCKQTSETKTPVLETKMKLPSSIKFVDETLMEAFENLSEGKTEDTKLFNWLNRAFRDIEDNAFCGIQIPKRLIPK